MAKTSAVWGIDIGNSSLKALRCRPSEMEGRVEALAFDFIEHSKILSQPGAEPAEILAETIQTFLSRNDTKGDQIAISVSGQNTISRFLKLPPVDPKKVPDIIKYEAKQWLPFDLDDVIWDFQPIGKPPQSDSAVPMDSEVGMFAMKRDIAMKTLEPYLTNGINIDCIQSSPLAIYNFAAFDQLNTRNIEVYDPDNPPESIVVLCVGTDATDVVITNGFSIWIRSIPIGGNVFTKALTKGLKLTFSKAEYLKRNAAAAQDPKAVFQAMRPVFNDMLSEVHRSLEYYQGLNRHARFGKILAMGNAMKMPGLRQFLTQNLGYEVTRLTQFNRLVGGEVTEAAPFKENLFSFGVCYGLVLQQLGMAALSTNLIPKEIVTDRIIREKKPWALAGAAAILFGLTLQFTGASQALKTISSGAYGAAEQRAVSVTNYSSKLKSDTQKVVGIYQEIDKIGKNLTSNVEGRITWLELLKAINSALPHEQDVLEGKAADLVSKQNRIFISNIEAIAVNDLATWFAPLKEFKCYYPDEAEIAEILKKRAEGGTSDAAGTDPSTGGAVATAKIVIPRSLDKRLEMIEGPEKGISGRVVQIVGYHYHNAKHVANIDAEDFGSGYVRNTLIRKLKFGTVVLPATLERQSKEKAQTARDDVSMRDLGISYPTLMNIPKIVDTEIINPRVILEIYLEERRKELENRNNTGKGGGGIFGNQSARQDNAGQAFGSAMTTGLFRNNPNTWNASPTAGAPGQSGGRNEETPAEYIKRVSKEIGAEDRISLRRFDFVVQFAWEETPPSVREKRKEEERKAELARREAAAVAAGTSVLEGEVSFVENESGSDEPVDGGDSVEQPEPATTTTDQEDEM